MKQVLKYPLTLGCNDLSIPPDAKIVLVGNQHGNLTMWVEVQPGPFITRRFMVYGTGHIIPFEEVHIGSAIMDSFVWHVFECKF